jgi:hypothetical protein
MAKIDTAKIRNFVTHDVWHVKLDKFPKWQRGMIKILRVSILAVKDFVRKNLALRASALTLYSLLSIVPVVAMIFGIAQGFGLQGLNGLLPFNTSTPFVIPSLSQSASRSSSPSS